MPDPLRNMLPGPKSSGANIDVSGTPVGSIAGSFGAGRLCCAAPACARQAASIAATTRRELVTMVRVRAEEIVTGPAEAARPQIKRSLSDEQERRPLTICKNAIELAFREDPGLSVAVELDDVVVVDLSAFHPRRARRHAGRGETKGSRLFRKELL